MKQKYLSLLIIGFALVVHVPAVQALASGPTCVDTVFKFQSNFWVNLHLFLRAEEWRRSGDIPPQMPVASLSPDERSAWEAALDAYARMAKANLIFDDGLVRLTNTLAEVNDSTVLKSNLIDPRIANALKGAAPVYRAHLWSEHQNEDEEWIVTHCPDIQRYDVGVKNSIGQALDATPPREPILVDLARETGRTLAYTIPGPAGTSGHTVIAPQKATDSELVLNTILHEISHTMDSRIRDDIDQAAARQQVKPPEDLWHAVTLYTTCEITKRALAKDGRPATSLDTDRATMFERNGWQNILTALKKDWQPYLNKRVSLSFALQNLLRDTAK
ncbi:MAG TPA: hypothetical protein VF018_05140 [Acidobacteriaceae bacterium]